MSLYVHEVYYERRGSKLLGIGDSPVYETGMKTPAEIYRSAQKEFGRCTSRVYIEGPSGNSLHIGWVFVKRTKYQDSNETYLQETWVTIHDDQPERTITYNYHII